MLANRGYAAYANNKVMTASPAELTLMLYEGAIKFANIAIEAIEAKDVQKAHDNIMKVERIIEEFQSTLNHKYPVAKDFDEVYNYLMVRLQEANMKKDKEIMEEVLKHLRTMRDTWKQVMKLAHTQQYGPRRDGEEPIYTGYDTEPEEKKRNLRCDHGIKHQAERRTGKSVIGSG